MHVTNMHYDHNHEKMADLVGLIPNQRRGAIKDSKEFLQHVANVKADTKLLQYEISRRNENKFKVKRKDIYDFDAKNKESTGINDREELGNKLRKIDGATVKLIINDQQQLQGIFFQVGRMRNYFDVYADICLCNAIYYLNDRYMALVILLMWMETAKAKLLAYSI